MKLTAAITAACALILGATAAPTVSNGLPEGYTEFIPSWEVEVHPGGPKVIVNGTVEEVRDQMLKLNPNYDLDYPINTTEVERRSLDARADFSRASHQCNLWAAAKSSRIKEGIAYLYGLQGQSRPRNGAGPGNCGRVSCSWKSAIYWCNNNNTPRELDGWGDIADGANMIWVQCTMNGLKDTLSGEARHPSGFTVQVSAANC